MNNRLIKKKTAPANFYRCLKFREGVREYGI
jgi:hypothetical protein